MITISFSSPYDEKEIEKISIISENDHFNYGIYVKDNILVESQMIDKSALLGFFEKHSQQNTSFHFMSKSGSFTHVSADQMSIMEGKTNYKEKFLYEPIYCYYDTKFDFKPQNLKHFSSAIHQYYCDRLNYICYAYFGKNKLYLCICGMDFKFYNVFEIENDADLIYYIKSVLKNIKCPEDEIQIMVNGYVEEQSTYYKALSKYFQNVSFTEDNKFSIRNKDVKPHSYFDHFLNIRYRNSENY